MKIVYKVKELHKCKKLTQVRLSKISGVSKRLISDVERGEKHLMVPKLCYIAIALNVKAEELFYIKKYKEK